MPPLLHQNLAKTVAGMRELLSRQKGGDDKGLKQSASPEPAAQAKEPLTRIAVALEGMKQDGADSHQGRQGTGGGSYDAMSTMKGEPVMRQTEIPSQAQHRNGLFRETLESIIQKSQVVVKDGRNGSFSMRLNPRELGSVSIHLGLHDGVVHGRFLVTTQEARDLLLVNIENIKEQLGEAGITIGEFQVNVSDQGGKTLHEDDGDGTSAAVPADQAAEIEGEYRANTIMRHEGHINVII